jgi:hypothetical protein
MPLKPHPTDPDKMVYVKHEYAMPEVTLNTISHPQGDPAPENLNSESLEIIEVDLRPMWANLIQGVRVEGDFVIIKVKGGNDAARELCGALIDEVNK